MVADFSRSLPPPGSIADGRFCKTKLQHREYGHRVTLGLAGNAVSQEGLVPIGKIGKCLGFLKSHQ